MMFLHFLKERTAYCANFLMKNPLVMLTGCPLANQLPVKLMLSFTLVVE